MSSRPLIKNLKPIKNFIFRYNYFAVDLKSNCSKVSIQTKILTILDIKVKNVDIYKFLDCYFVELICFI